MGIGQGINRRELLQIAMSDSQYVIQVQDFNSLKQKLEMILDDSCQGNVAGISITPRVFPNFGKTRKAREKVTRARYVEDTRDGGKSKSHARVHFSHSVLSTTRV